MRTIKALNGQFSLKAYQFKDLDEKAKEKVINDHINFWLDVIPYEDMSENQKKAVDRAERMRTPWFTGSYMYEYCLDELLEEIEINNYLFDCDGGLLPITYYTKDSKIVKTVFRFFSKEVEVKPIYGFC